MNRLKRGEWILVLALVVYACERKPVDFRASCTQFEQPYDGGCVPNAVWIDRNLAGEVTRDGGEGRDP